MINYFSERSSQNQILSLPRSKWRSVPTLHLCDKDSYQDPKENASVGSFGYTLLFLLKLPKIISVFPMMSIPELRDVVLNSHKARISFL